MRSHHHVLLALLLSCAQHAAAVNKCVSDEGDQITYTDAPCATEAQPVNAQDNTVVLDPVDKARARRAQNEVRQGTQDVRRTHDAQYSEALRIQRAAEAEERARASRNSQVRPIVPRAPTVQNPVAPSGNPTWHP